MTTNRIVWEKDGTCWEICGNVSKRLSHQDKQTEEKYNIGNSSPTKVEMLKIRPQIKKLPISLTITEELSSTNIYIDRSIGGNKWIYYEDADKQNSHMIQIGGHLHYRKKDQFTFIGIVIKKKFGGTSNLLKKGVFVECDYYILTIDPKKKSLGLGLSPNTIVPKIGEDHPRFIRFKKNGEDNLPNKCDFVKMFPTLNISYLLSKLFTPTETITTDTTSHPTFLWISVQGCNYFKEQSMLAMQKMHGEVACHNIDMAHPLQNASEPLALWEKHVGN